MKQSIETGRFACNYKSENERLCNCNEVRNEVLVCFIVTIIVIFEKLSIFKSLCMSQRLLVLQRILSFFLLLIIIVIIILLLDKILSEHLLHF